MIKIFLKHLRINYLQAEPRIEQSLFARFSFLHYSFIIAYYYWVITYFWEKPSI